MNFLIPRRYLCVLTLTAVGTLSCLGSYLRVLDIYELDTLDARFQLRPPIPVSDQIAIIEIGNDSIEKIGRFPFDRSYHALLIKALSAAGAKAIVFDIFFSEPQPKDEELQQAITLAGNVYLPHVFHLRPYAKAIKGKAPAASPSGRRGLSEQEGLPSKAGSYSWTASGYAAQSLEYFTLPSKATGHINIIPDKDGKFRRVPAVIRYKGLQYPFLPVAVAENVLEIDRQNKLPVDEQGYIIINFADKWGQSYRHYSFVDVLKSYIAKFSGEQAVLDLNIFKDKVCFIGLTADGTADLHPTPFEPLYPSVGVHAEVFNAIANNNYIKRASKTQNLIILIIGIALLWWSATRHKPLKVFLVLLGLSTGQIIISIVAFNASGLWIDLACPIVVWVLLYGLSTVGRYIIEWKKNAIMENELAIAKKIQESFLPKRTPRTRGLEVAATMKTFRQVGGDFYDFFEFDPNQLGVVVGDVCGKGVPASLLMAMVTSAVKFFAKPAVKPEETLAQLNTKLIQDTSSEHFVTASYAIFDTNKNSLMYASAGHLPVLYIPRDKPPQYLNVEEGLPLGILEGPYSGNKINFNKEDIFIIYTDGITEARSGKGEFYDTDKLAALAERIKDQTAAYILKEILINIESYTKNKNQHDDMTLIVVKIIS